VTENDIAVGRDAMPSSGVADQERDHEAGAGDRALGLGRQRDVGDQLGAGAGRQVAEVDDAPVELGVRRRDHGAQTEAGTGADVGERQGQAQAAGREDDAQATGLELRELLEGLDRRDRGVDAPGGEEPGARAGQDAGIDDVIEAELAVGAGQIDRQIEGRHARLEGIDEVEGGDGEAPVVIDRALDVEAVPQEDGVAGRDRALAARHRRAGSTTRPGCRWGDARCECR
jgi:hypothetical protein